MEEHFYGKKTLLRKENISTYILTYNCIIPSLQLEQTYTCSHLAVGPNSKQLDPQLLLHNCLHVHSLPNCPHEHSLHSCPHGMRMHLPPTGTLLHNCPPPPSMLLYFHPHDMLPNHPLTGNLVYNIMCILCNHPQKDYTTHCHHVHVTGQLLSLHVTVSCPHATAGTAHQPLGMYCPIALHGHVSARSLPWACLSTIAPTDTLLHIAPQACYCTGNPMGRLLHSRPYGHVLHNRPHGHVSIHFALMGMFPYT